MISKTTANYASRRNLLIDDTFTNDDGITFLMIFGLDTDMEPMVQYIEGENGGWHFHANIYLPQNVKEELPAWIVNESELRKVIDFIYANQPA